MLKIGPVVSWVERLEQERGIVRGDRPSEPVGETGEVP